MQTAFVRDYATNNFGDESPENIRKSINSLAHMAQNNPNSLNKMIEGFVSGHGYGWGRTNRQVTSAMDSIKNQTHDDAILKGAVDYTTNTAGQKSSGVTPDSLTPPDPKGLREPDQTSVQEKTDSLRSRNRFEESPGDGRIRTSVTGMATEGVGKVFKGLVDSQGDRVTDEGAFDHVHPIEKSYKGSATPGPIPKDAISTLK